MSFVTPKSVVPLLVVGTLALGLAACSNSDKNGNNGTQNTPAAQAADNTGQNAADSSSALPTPMDQGESALDRGITQAIRQIVVGDQSLSTNAHNIKIITVNGHVTLRGPVDSQAEVDQLTRVAQGVAGVTSVDAQLNVAQH